MGQIWNKEFTGGLDARRMPVAAAGGTLIEGTNGHITSGGEFEQRAAFVNTFQLPEGTVGLAADNNGVLTFGGGDEPAGMPAGIIYQQLEHPDGDDKELIRVPSFDLYAGKVYAVGEFIDSSIHHFYDAEVVEDWYDGKARASFRVTGGGTGASLSTLKVDGVSIISGTVSWATSHFATAAAIAAAINSHTSSPNYSATSFEDQVNIIADAGVAPNGRVVAYTVASGLVLTPDSGFALAGGAAPEDTYAPGRFVRTIGSKMYALSGPVMHFSGIQQPMQWTTDAVGAGFIDMSIQASGSEELQAIAKYQNLVAVFSKKNIQTWYVDPDPALNKISQVLNNTGTISPRSVTQFGDNDLFYVNNSGVRSLRARDSSNAAATTDIGVPVDKLITKTLRLLSEEDKAYRVFGLIEPRESRFWLIIRDTIFVFSYFPGSKVSAWTMYLPGFVVDDVVLFGDFVYLRSGNTVYVYGGLGADLAYAGAPGAVARAPFLDGGNPTLKKNLEGVDIAAEGEWQVWIGMDSTDETALDKLAVADGTTYHLDKLGAQGTSTHFSPRFVAKGGEYAKLGAFVIHYTGDDSED